MPFATGHGGAQIYYETTGDRGPWVVLIQGLGLSSRFWFHMPQLLAGDPDHPHRVLVLDNRGSGRSDRPRGPYRMGHMADDVAAVIRAAGVDRPIVCGISMGGMIAQEVALRHPTLVGGLVLLATWAGIPHVQLPRPFALATLLSMPFRTGRSRGRALARLLLPRTHVRLAKDVLGAWPDAFAAEPPDPRAFFAQAMAAALHTTGFRLKQILCPTVVVCGEEDAIMRRRNAEILAARIPNARLEILPGVAHGIPITDERAIARAVASISTSRRDPRTCTEARPA
jgi:3-oxoadipate enol-lactonase